MKKMVWDDWQIDQFKFEIDWLEKEIATKNLSNKNIDEYRHQIRKKELEIAFNRPRNKTDDITFNERRNNEKLYNSN